MDIMEQDLEHMRAGRAILKPVYQPQGRDVRAARLRQARSSSRSSRACSGYHTERLRDAFDVRVFLAPPEDLRRQWKVQRDCSRRGYTTDQVLEELDRREQDSAAFIRPQQQWADLVVSFMAGNRDDQEHLDAKIAMRKGLTHPDLAPFMDSDGHGLTLVEHAHESCLFVPGDIEPERAARLEEAVWDRMHFASHLRSERLGEFTVGTELHRSESLAIVQVLVLYHLVTARAAVALGGDHSRADRPSSITSSFPAVTSEA